MTAIDGRHLRIHYGGDYNPEQWPEEVWAEDARLMRDAGVSLVTVGVFAWARLEPQPGTFHAGWLDRVMDLMAEHGIGVDLATATASPPPWLGHLHPETLPVDVDGHRLWWGARQHYCPSSPVYRAHAVALVERLADRYVRHPALRMWHINNEYGAHVPRCYCDVSAADFRRWLQERHGDLDALNEAWGTAFWSQRYGDWDEVLPPRRAPTFRNPAQQLDFARFSSAALLACFEAERAVLARLTPGVPVTTNFMGLFEPLDYHAWAACEDLVSHDWYPDLEDPRCHIEGALTFDLMRSLGGGRPWMLMEQAPSAINWRARNRPKRPGQMRLWSLQAVARGADAVCFFQWRAARSGAEKFHSGMLPHAGPDTRVHREVRQLGAELAALSPHVAGTGVPTAAALLLDWESWWASELDAHPSADFRLRDLLLDWYTALWEAGVAVDVVHPAADLSAYRLVVAPNLYLLEEDTAAQLGSWVRAGGTLVLGFFSGVVDPNDAVRTGGYPALLRDVLGLRVEEFWPLLAGETVSCTSAALGDFTATFWAEDVRAEGASVVASYTTGDLAGVPAVLRHEWGAGTAWYVATRLPAATLRALLGQAGAEVGVEAALPEAPAGVEAVRRGDLLFLLNHGEDPVQITLAGPHETLLGDGPGALGAAGEIGLGRFGVAVLRSLADVGDVGG